MSKSQNYTFPKRSISEKKERELWEKGIFVWDTSAIGELYKMTAEARDVLLEILDKETVADRIWIPDRVLAEFNRHANEFATQTIREHYQQPDFLAHPYVRKLRDFVEKLKSDAYYHPKFDDATVAKLAALSQKAEKLHDAVRITIENALKEAADKIRKDAPANPIPRVFRSFDCGSPFSWSELMDIVREGTTRYEHKIPPGYMDEKKKSSIDKFGDLIIWKEICRHAAEERTDVIFICNDCKEDWNAGDPKRNEMIPREELLDEFHSISGRTIWFYTLNGFISNFKKYLVSHTAIEELDQLNSILAELEVMEFPDDSIKVVCENCGKPTYYESSDFSWEWEHSYSYERKMGAETTFEYEQTIACPNCGAEHTFRFEMYQYPLNVVNYASVEVGGCRVVSMEPMERFIEYDRMDSCLLCGRWGSDISSDGYCRDCLDEFDYKVSHD